MNKRSNLPYTTQDLFAQPPPTPGSSRTRPGSISGSIGSNASNGHYEAPSFANSNTSTLRSLQKMLKRVFKPTTLDFETAMWEIFNLIINPKKMYRSQYYYKQYQNGKTSFARDDPSFIILLTTFLSMSAIAWGLAYSPHILDIFKLIIYMVFVDFYITGVIISTISWLVTNRIFNKTWGANRYNVNYIEWGFCFDIHCNSFLIIWCLLYLVQFFLLPLITIKNSFFSLLLGNTLYFVSIGYYFVITFYGFNSLTIVNQPTTTKVWDNPSRLLQVIIIAGILPILALIWIITLIARVNVAYFMIDTYFN
ncbi:protein Gmh1p [[Candida] jaroonii]|uniref:Protein Gmh1p n=1 Tax=[Candida] jaroonii TaxID=467808 RepID=A0ACA9XZW9_9ASCO|nr:protein Gmh1p [[Candida] jaroonii]